MHGHTTHLIPFIISVQPGMFVHLCSLFYTPLHSCSNIYVHYAGWKPISKAKFSQASNLVPKFCHDVFKEQFLGDQYSLNLASALRGLQRAPFCGLSQRAHVLMRNLAKIYSVFPFQILTVLSKCDLVRAYCQGKFGRVGLPLAVVRFLNCKRNRLFYQVWRAYIHQWWVL